MTTTITKPDWLIIWMHDLHSSICDTKRLVKSIDDCKDEAERQAFALCVEFSRREGRPNTITVGSSIAEGRPA